MDERVLAALGAGAASSSGAGSGSGVGMSQAGFTLFEALVAALILAVAVAGVMRLHTHNLQYTAANFELQNAYWVLTNAQQRFVRSHSLSSADVSELTEQLKLAGLRGPVVVAQSEHIAIGWRGADAEPWVQRDGCAALHADLSALNCIAVRVR